jgi:hypothetical protein
MAGAGINPRVSRIARVPSSWVYEHHVTQRSNGRLTSTVSRSP